MAYLGVKLSFFERFLATAKEEGPLKRMTAIEPTPWLVAIAAIVSISFSY